VVAHVAKAGRACAQLNLDRCVTTALGVARVLVAARDSLSRGVRDRLTCAAAGGAGASAALAKLDARGAAP